MLYSNLRIKIGDVKMLNVPTTKDFPSQSTTSSLPKSRRTLSVVLARIGTGPLVTDLLFLRLQKTTEMQT